MSFEDLENFRDEYFPWRANTPENWEARTAKTHCHQFANNPQPADGCSVSASDRATAGGDDE